MCTWPRKWSNKSGEVKEQALGVCYSLESRDPWADGFCIRCGEIGFPGQLLDWKLEAVLCSNQHTPISRKKLENGHSRVSSLNVIVYGF